MSELVLTLFRLGFLAALWALVIAAILVLRRDLRAPRDARPLVAVPTVRAGSTADVAATARGNGKPVKAAKPSKAAKNIPKSLVVIEGPLKGTIIPLGQSDITIGRAGDSTIVLDDDYASSNHARISFVDGSWVAQDLGSTNGTWIDRARITTPITLRPGQQIKVGRTVLELQR
jgi:pSer/pThr/pTyr-binding forkhead associated (FHA) protein